jgi:hypothetical protein
MPSHGACAPCKAGPASGCCRPLALCALLRLPAIALQPVGLQTCPHDCVLSPVHVTGEEEADFYKRAEAARKDSNSDSRGRGRKRGPHSGGRGGRGFKRGRR